MQLRWCRAPGGSHGHCRCGCDVKPRGRNIIPAAPAPDSGHQAQHGCWHHVAAADPHGELLSPAASHSPWVVLRSKPGSTSVSPPCQDLLHPKQTLPAVKDLHWQVLHCFDPAAPLHMLLLEPATTPTRKGRWPSAGAKRSGVLFALRSA